MLALWWSKHPGTAPACGQGCFVTILPCLWDPGEHPRQGWEMRFIKEGSGGQHELKGVGKIFKIWKNTFER